jgi:hypothetical protein
MFIHQGRCEQRKLGRSATSFSLSSSRKEDGWMDSTAAGGSAVLLNLLSFVPLPHFRTRLIYWQRFPCQLGIDRSIDCAMQQQRKF